jgi:hypothetical protein
MFYTCIHKTKNIMNKTSIILGLALLLAGNTFAQNISADKVPAAVKTKFAALYPAVKDVKWEMEKADYEGAFTQGKTNMSVVIDPQGTLKETETKITVAELPKSVTDYLAKKYPAVKIDEAAKIVDAKGKLIYEAEVKGKDVLFDDKGNFIK